MSRTVYLHIGIAKTGTTYLQRTLYANRVLLERHGTRYPGPGPAAHFLGSLDLRDATFAGHHYDRAQGAWSRLVAQADTFTGNTLISHETLAQATPQQMTRAVSSFGTADVRVVITCRDLARQLPAMWQERLKNRSKQRYATFLAKVFDDYAAAGGPRGTFWRAQHIEGLVGRWASAVGPSQVYVVTVPPRGAHPRELWRRFARATELPDAEYTFADDGGNSSMGVAEAELLRRLNPLLDELDWPQYDALVKKDLAVRVLGELETHGRLTLPQAWQPQVADIAGASISFLRDADVHLIGDVADLEPVSADIDAVQDGRQPADLEDADVLDVALRTMAAMLLDPRAAEPLGEPLRVRMLDRLRSRLDPLRSRLTRR